MAREMKNTSRIQATSEPVSAELEGETVVLYPKTGEYFSMGGTGSWIYEFVKQPRTVLEIRSALLEVFDVEPERCLVELRSFLQELASEGIIDVLDG